MHARKRESAGFNLAFLDIMACGLGAIILIFMLVKDQAVAPNAELEILRADLSQLRGELGALEDALRELAADIEARKQDLQLQAARAAKSDEASSAAAAEIIELAKQIANLEREKSRAQKNIERTKTEVAAEEEHTEEHLLGLRVRGKFIIILLDISASMAAEQLRDIIKYKVQDSARRRAAPKWKRALAAARWIAARVPADSRYRIIHYNDRATLLPEKWLRGGDARARARLFADLEKLHPHGATNLHQALRAISVNKLNPSDIYVITDSLPTQGNLSPVRRLKDCGLEKNTVTGKCRLSLMYAAIKSFPGISARINTLLLPVEGDPDAAYAYWAWSASTTGVMVGPEATWP